MLVWQVNSEIQNILESIKSTYHHPRLEEASIAMSFNDGKSFVGGRFNWGKLSKFSSLAKLWHPENKRYDFHISFPADSWHGLLNSEQRKAWIDLHLCRCQVEYVPVTVEVNGKKKTQKDEWGRVQFTSEIKRDEEGSPKWKVIPMDLGVFQENVMRFGCWCQDLFELKSAIEKHGT